MTIPRIAPVIQEQFTSHRFLDPELNGATKGAAQDWIEKQVVKDLNNRAREAGFLEDEKDFWVPVKWKGNIATATVHLARVDREEWPMVADLYWAPDEE
jgi:hypothetical protein